MSQVSYIELVKQWSTGKLTTRQFSDLKKRGVYAKFPTDPETCELKDYEDFPHACAACPHECGEVAAQ